MKKRLPATRKSITHKGIIHAQEGRVKFFITVGLFDDGRPGEIFLTLDEAGSTLDGYSNAWAIAVSMLLQEGVTLEKIHEKFSFQNFAPYGMSENKQIGFARSIPDYVVRWMKAEFTPKE